MVNFALRKRGLGALQVKALMWVEFVGSLLCSKWLGHSLDLL